MSSCTLSVGTVTPRHGPPIRAESVTSASRGQTGSLASTQDHRYHCFCFNTEAIFESIPIEWCRCTNPPVLCLRPSSIFRAQQAGWSAHASRSACSWWCQDSRRLDFLTNCHKFLYSGVPSGSRRKERQPIRELHPKGKDMKKINF